MTHDNQKRPSQSSTADYLVQLESERDELRRKLGHAEKRAAQGEFELAVSQGREEGGRVELWHRANDLKDANETISRQRGSLGGQRDSIASFAKWRRTSDTTSKNSNRLTR